MSRLVFNSKGRFLGFSTGGAAAVDSGDSGGDVTGRQTIFVPSSAMRPRQSEGAAALAFLEIGESKVNYPFLGFDANTDEFVQFITLMPKSWDLDPFKVRVLWSRGVATGTYTVSWGVSCAAITTDDALSVSFGSEIEIASEASSQDTGIISPESANITPSGTPSKDGTSLIFQIRRITANDALNVDARLHGVAILYNTDANTDD